MVRVVAVTLLCLALGCATTDYDFFPVDFERDYWPDEDDRIAFDAMIGGWSLHGGYTDAIGVPVEYFRVLFAVHTGREEVRLVRGFRDLVGLVRIRTPAQALRFARIATGTSGDTWYYFLEKDFLGARARAEIPWPLSAAFEISPTTNEPGFWELPADDFRQLGLHLPIVRRAGDGFVIARCVGVNFGGVVDDVTAYWVTERVEADGRYRVLSTSVAATGLDIMEHIVY